MSKTRYQLAQVNVARMLAPLASATMESFVALLDELNALADRSVGFVWRLQGDDGNATYVRPFEDDRVLVNMSVWDSVEALRSYTYGTAHVDALRRRREWFSHFGQPSLALWWVPAGHVPTVSEARLRLDYLTEHGPTLHAFTLKNAFDRPTPTYVLPAALESLPCTTNLTVSPDVPTPKGDRT